MKSPRPAGKHTRPRVFAGTHRRCGFTLVEMVVVVGIILVLIGLVLPSVSDMWESRKLSSVENMLEGLLLSARARAMEVKYEKAGLLFYVDETGTQRAAPIASLRPGAAEKWVPAGTDVGWMTMSASATIFEFVATEREHTFASPVRLAPRYAVEVQEPATGSDPKRFSEEELANSNFLQPPAQTDQAQRHRNYFTVVFDSQGRLEVGGNALMLDIDVAGDGFGDRTGLPVGAGGPGVTLEVDEFFSLITNARTRIDARSQRNPGLSAGRVPYLIAVANGGDKVAVNFPSVDGVVVYDNTLFSAGDVPAAYQRETLLARGRVLHINRLTGRIIHGADQEVAP